MGNASGVLSELGSTRSRDYSPDEDAPGITLDQYPLQDLSVGPLAEVLYRRTMEVNVKGIESSAPLRMRFMNYIQSKEWTESMSIQHKILEDRSHRPVLGLGFLFGYKANGLLINVLRHYLLRKGSNPPRASSQHHSMRGATPHQSHQRRIRSDSRSLTAPSDSSSLTPSSSIADSHFGKGDSPSDSELVRLQQLEQLEQKESFDREWEKIFLFEGHHQFLLLITAAYQHFLVVHSRRYSGRSTSSMSTVETSTTNATRITTRSSSNGGGGGGGDHRRLIVGGGPASSDSCGNADTNSLRSTGTANSGSENSTNNSCRSGASQDVEPEQHRKIMDNDVVVVDRDVEHAVGPTYSGGRGKKLPKPASSSSPFSLMRLRSPGNRYEPLSDQCLGVSANATTTSSAGSRSTAACTPAAVSTKSAAFAGKGIGYRREDANSGGSEEEEHDAAAKAAAEAAAREEDVDLDEEEDRPLESVVKRIEFPALGAAVSASSSAGDGETDRECEQLLRARIDSSSSSSSDKVDDSRGEKNSRGAAAVAVAMVQTTPQQRRQRNETANATKSNNNNIHSISRNSNRGSSSAAAAALTSSPASAAAAAAAEVAVSSGARYLSSCLPYIDDSDAMAVMAKENWVRTLFYRLESLPIAISVADVVPGPSSLSTSVSVSTDFGLSLAGFLGTNSTHSSYSYTSNNSSATAATVNNNNNNNNMNNTSFRSTTSSDISSRLLRSPFSSFRSSSAHGAAATATATASAAAGSPNAPGSRSGTGIEVGVSGSLHLVDDAAALQSRAAAARAKDAQFPLCYVNTHFEKLSGRRRREIFGERKRFFFHLSQELSEPLIEEELESAIKEGRPTKVVVGLARSGGKAYHSFFAMVPIFDHNGQYVKVLGLHCDSIEQHCSIRLLEWIDVLLQILPPLFLYQ